ncbi:MAG: hypothetical protein JW712_07865 [Dehalococcoidales bacterium]|nr:hypothetical protein [Dehalococcoidales bacterium]
MGAVLVSYFDKAKEKGGLEALVKMAMLTKMSKQKAENSEDSKENIELFVKALSQV